MNHQHFIHHCLSLASRGRGKTGLNPMVDACLVQEGEIVAEGWHREYGELHAERELLENYEQKISTSFDFAQDDILLYVNLEPCCQKGKTPACTDIIIEKGIQTVVFGMYDPNPAVNGKGIQILKEKNIHVIGPILSEQCRRFNRGFVSLQEQGRPWITLKKAQRTDGSIDGKITSQEQDAWSHTYLRALHDAVLIGVGTVVEDDPLLTVRIGEFCHTERSRSTTKFQPWRIILDPHLRIPSDARVVSGELAEGTLLIVGPDIDEDKKESLRERGVWIQEIPLEDEQFDLDALFAFITTPTDSFCGITSILVEGGPTTWDMFKKANLVDEEVILAG